MVIFDTDALLLYSGWFMNLKFHVTLIGGTHIKLTLILLTWKIR